MGADPPFAEGAKDGPPSTLCFALGVESALAVSLLARSDAKGGDLAAAAGDVGEAGGAEAGEEAAEFALEEVGGEVYEHVFVFNVQRGSRGNSLRG